MSRNYSLLNTIKSIITTKSSNNPNNERNQEYNLNDSETNIIQKEPEPELDILKEQLAKIKKSKGQDFSQVEQMDSETVLQEIIEYKQDFYEMSIGSLKAIAAHANDILNSLETPHVRENLTESWLQGKIAITEDYMRTVHDFIMFSSDPVDNLSAAGRPGLWDNIRKKKEREGKKYRPAKPGDKDRPDSQMWKKLTKDSKKQ